MESTGDTICLLSYQRHLSLCDLTCTHLEGRRMKVLIVDEIFQERLAKAEKE